MYFLKKMEAEVFQLNVFYRKNKKKKAKTFLSRSVI